MKYITCYISKWGVEETFKIVVQKVIINDKTARYVGSKDGYNLYTNDNDEMLACIFN